MKRLSTIPLILIVALVGASFGAERVVKDDAELMQAAYEAKPGDEIVMKNGAWSDMLLVFLAKGSEAAPVVLRPETPGKVVITGTSSLKIGGEHLVVRDLVFRDGVRPKFTTRDKASQYESDVIALHVNGEHAARHVRLTGILMENWKSMAAYRVRWIYMVGVRNRIDHCRFIGQADRGETIVVATDGTPTHHRIDHNYFGKRPKGDKNGFEVMRIGGGATRTWDDARVLVEHNVFDDCDGEGETISNKSTGNTYRYNLFRGCRGELVLRRGDNCTVVSNRFENCLGGIRISGKGHTVMNNVVVDSDVSGIRMIAGWKNPKSPVGYNYLPVEDCTIANNTIVNPGREGILFGEWMKGHMGLDGKVRAAGGTILPAGNRIVNNIVTANKGVLIRLRGATDNTIRRNLLYATDEAKVGEAGEEPILAAPGFADPAKGDYRIPKGSPAHVAGVPVEGVDPKGLFVGATAEPFEAGPDSGMGDR